MCLPRGCVCPGRMSALGVPAWGCLPGGGVCHGGVSAMGDVCPAGVNPPMNRMTDRQVFAFEGGKYVIPYSSI